MKNADIKVKRSQTPGERRAQAEEEYNQLYKKYRTHNFLDWGTLTQVHEEDANRKVPPYCYRFDEFLAFWLGGEHTYEVPQIMNEFFPEPDSIDCDYLEEILATLANIWGGPRDIYIAHKGSKLGIGPGVGHNYANNVARAQRWLQEVKEELAMKKIHQFSPLSTQTRAPYSPKSAASLASFFQKGFTVEKLDRLLIKLGMMDDSRKLTDDSKPRTWVSIIQALSDEKILIPASYPALLDALMQEYNNQDSLPKLRTLQKGYTATNAQARDFYDRAMALLKAR
jgi:hypothetical protein